MAPKYKELWKKSGIDLDNATKSRASCNISLGINQLKLPDELIAVKNHQTAIDEKPESNDDDTEQKSTVDSDVSNDDGTAVPAEPKPIDAEAQNNDDDNEKHKQQKFEDLLDSARLLEEIRKDVVRTHPDLYFFLEPENNLGSRRYAAIERILFVWARLNKGVSCLSVFC